jgi:hypothetical protein
VAAAAARTVDGGWSGRRWRWRCRRHGDGGIGLVPLPAVHPLDLLRLLLDPDRLATVGAIARRAATSEELAAQVGRSPAEVLRTLAPLVQAGLVRREAGGYHLDAQAWQALAQDLPQAAPPSPRVAFGMTGEEAELLGRFFVGERLVELPAQRGKRLVVLERLALEFEPGRRYPEAEVNTLLGRFHPDHATLRRLLVDEGFLDRAGGEYWRAGGRVV